MTLSSTHLNATHDRFVVGLPLRTSPATAATDVPATWQRFMQEGWLQKLPQKADDSAIYAVYTDYVSDETGPYTMVLGVSVDRETQVPEGLRRVCIPAGEVASFRVEGDPAEVVWKAWAHVNGPWKERTRRRYVADFERYPLASLTPSSAVVDVTVGLSPA